MMVFEFEFWVFVAFVLRACELVLFWFVSTIRVPYMYP